MEIKDYNCIKVYIDGSVNFVVSLDSVVLKTN